MRRRAFTLLEVMLTMAITATVFAMIGGILLSVINTTENVSNVLRTEKAGDGILGVIRRDLTGVYAYALGGLAFKGKNDQELGRDADSLHFVTTADVMESEDGTTPRLIEIGYRVAPDDSGKLLVLYRRAVALQGDPITADEDYVELYGELHSLNFEYLDADGEWQEEWEDTEAIPVAVKIKIELALDEAQRIAEEQGRVDIPEPVYQIVVGIPTTLGPKAKDDEGTQQPPPAPGGG